MLMRFQLANVWSTSLRSPVTHAARFSAAICRNQLDSGFQLAKIWLTTHLSSRLQPFAARRMADGASELNQLGYFGSKGISTSA